MMLFKDLPLVYMSYEAEWQQPWLMLKLIYDTATDANVTTADAMYCAIERSSKPQSPCDKARYEKIMHTYCDVSTPDNTWGLAILNEGKYAYDATGSQMRLTLLRTATYTTAAGEAWVNEERKLRKEKDGSAPPKYIDLGFFRCRYALLPHNNGALKNADGTPNGYVKRMAEEFNQKVIVQKVTNEENGSSFLVNGTSIINCNPSNVLITALKQKEWEPSKNLILRLAEVSGQACDLVQIQFCPDFASSIDSIHTVDLLERSIDVPCSWDSDSGILTCAIGKFEILSFELVLK
jgi:alpha-mannosidase